MISLLTAQQNFYATFLSREAKIKELADCESMVEYCQDKSRDNTIPPQFVERKKFNLVQFIRWAISECRI